VTLTQRIRQASSRLLGWRYGTGPATRFPYLAPSIPPTLVTAGPSCIDCSSLTTWVLATVYPSHGWDQQSYEDMQIYDPTRPWSPVEAVERFGVGSRVVAPVGGAWHLTQGWRSLDPLAGGHARLAYAHPADPDSLVVLESTSRDGGRGPTWTRTTWAKLLHHYRNGDVVAVALGEG
jgi:hypothetical protein